MVSVQRAGEELSSTLLGQTGGVGGGSCGGGVLVPFGTTVPWGVSSEGQGGPWAPPPCGEQIC